MKIIQSRTVWAVCALMLLVAFTRTNHFGTALQLPDASWAVFLLAGFLVASPLLFVALLLEVGSVDYFAITVQGVNDYCFTPAYWFLIPTYAVLWSAGRYGARIHRRDLRGLGMFAGIALIATSAAFLLSNAAFYLFAGYFEKMGVIGYALSVARYYPSYLAGTALYLIPAVLIYSLLTQRNSTGRASTRHAG
ncbi:MAG: hypothetical protein ACOY3V_00565 [Pseudomonadota bacterium]